MYRNYKIYTFKISTYLHNVLIFFITLLYVLLYMFWNLDVQNIGKFLCKMPVLKSKFA